MLIIAKITEQLSRIDANCSILTQLCFVSDEFKINQLQHSKSIYNIPLILCFQQMICIFFNVCLIFFNMKCSH